MPPLSWSVLTGDVVIGSTNLRHFRRAVVLVVHLAVAATTHPGDRAVDRRGHEANDTLAGTEEESNAGTGNVGRHSSQNRDRPCDRCESRSTVASGNFATTLRATDLAFSTLIFSLFCRHTFLLLMEWGSARRHLLTTGVTERDDAAGRTILPTA